MTENINSWNFWPILSCIIFGQEKHCGNLFTNNAFPLQKERMESMETIKQNISLLIKSDNSYVELSFWRRLKLRFSSRLQRRHERETECADLLKEAFENLDEALSYVAQMKKYIYIYNTATFVFNLPHGKVTNIPYPTSAISNHFCCISYRNQSFDLQNNGLLHQMQ